MESAPRTPNHGRSGRGRRVRLAIALVGIALLVRAPGLFPSLWLDEVVSVSHAAGSPVEVVERVAKHDNHPPLYFVALSLWAPRPAPEAWIRSLSLVAGLGTVLVAAAIALSLSGPRAAWMAGALAATTQTLSSISYEARAFSLFAFLALLAWYCLIRARQRRGVWRWALAGLFAALSCYTFYYGFLFALALWVYLLASNPRPGEVKAWAVACVGAALLYVPWIPTLLGHWGLVSSRTAGGYDAFPADPVHLLRALLTHVRLGPWGSGPVPFVLLGVLAVGLAVPRWRGARAEGADTASRRSLVATAVFFLAFVCMVLAYGVAGGYVRARYASVLGGVGAVLAALVLVRLPRRLALALLLVMTVLGGAYAFRRSVVWDPEDWRGLARRLREDVRPGEPVFCVAGYTAQCLRYYASGAYPIVAVPEELGADADGHQEVLPADLAALARRVQGLDGFVVVWAHAEAANGREGVAAIREAFERSGCALVRDPASGGEPAFHGIEAERYRRPGPPR